jgi:hypothetical protein
MRFAQDDGFVGGLKYSWLDMQKTQKDREVTGSRDDSSVCVVMNPLRQATSPHE